MKLLDKLLKKNPGCGQRETGVLYAPVTGTYIPLSEVKDEVFSQGILGKGCGIEPAEGRVTAPADGIVSAVASTKHAIGLTLETGMEVIIHVGIDTVNLNGKGFTVKASEGKRVKCGETLLLFDMDTIRKAGYPVSSVFVVTNCANFPHLQMKVGSMYRCGEAMGSQGI